MTALTAYGSFTASSTLSTCDLLLLNPTTGAGTSNTTNSLLGAASGFGEIWSQTNAGAWAAGSLNTTIAPTGHGFLADSTLLEGMRLAAGNYTPTIRLGMSAGSIVADLYVRFYKRSSGGAYTQIGVCSLLAQSVTSTAATYTFSATSLPLMDFATGDKLYIDVWMNITTPATGTQNIRLIQSTSATVGAVTCQFVTPGYAATPATAALTLTAAGTSTLVGPLSLNTALSQTLAGTSTLAGGLSGSGALSRTLSGTSALSATLSASGGGVALTATVTGSSTLVGKLWAGFFTRSGASLLAPNGDPFRFAGVNIPWLGVLEAGTRYPTHFEIDDALRTAVEMGMTVIRSHTMGISVGSSYSIEPSLGVWNDAAFDPIDYAIYRAAQLGLRFIIPLTDSNNYYPGWMGTFTAWEGVATTTFYTNAAVIADFEAYINHLLTHVNQFNGLALKDDPTILMWETGNELNATGGANTGWISWTTTIGGYIKSVAPNALVLDGFYYTALNNLSSHLDRVTNANTDACSSHYYGGTVSTYSPAMTGDAAACSGAGKVYLVGEYDWTSASDTLANLTTWHGTMESTTGLSGDTVWALYPHNDTVAFDTHNDGYSLYYPGNDADTTSGTQMLERGQQLRNHAYAIAGLSSLKPAAMLTEAPRFTQISVVGADTALSWRGVVGAQLYQLERSPTGTGSWTTLSSTLVDNQGVYTDTAHTGNWYRVTGINVDGVAGASSAATLSLLAFTDTLAGTSTLAGTLSTASVIPLSIPRALSALLEMATPLSGTMSGISLLSASLLASRDLGGTSLVGNSTLAGGSMAQATALASLVMGTGTLAASITETTALAANLAAMGTLAAMVQEATSLSGGGLSGAGTLIGTLSLVGGTASLTSQLAAVGTLAGTVQEATSLTSAISGGSTLAGILASSVSIPASLTGTATLAGTLTAATSLPTGAASGVGTLTGTLTAAFSMSGATTAGIGTLSGTAQLATSLVLTVAGAGQMSGLLSATMSLPSGTLTGDGILVGAVALSTNLSAVLQACGTSVGVLTVLSLGSVTFVGAGTLSATEQLATALTTAVSGGSTLSGPLSATTGLGSGLAGSGALSGTLASNGVLSVVVAGTGQLAGSLAAARALSTGMSGTGALTGTLAAQVALTGQLAGVGSVQAAPDLAVSWTKTLVGTGAITGTGVFVTSLLVSMPGASSLSGEVSRMVLLATVLTGSGHLGAAIILGGGELSMCILTGTGQISIVFSFPGKSPTATWVTRDLQATWRTRDLAALWKTRDLEDTWKVRR